jgi:hypothetical protein
VPKPVSGLSKSNSTRLCASASRAVRPCVWDAAAANNIVRVACAVFVPAALCGSCVHALCGCLQAASRPRQARMIARPPM